MDVKFSNIFFKNWFETKLGGEGGIKLNNNKYVEIDLTRRYRKICNSSKNIVFCRSWVLRLSNLEQGDGR